MWYLQTAQMMRMLKQLYEHKMKQRHHEMRQRAGEHEKQQAKIEGRRQLKHKEIKKHAYRVLGQIEKKKKKHKQD